MPRRQPGLEKGLITLIELDSTINDYRQTRDNIDETIDQLEGLRGELVDEMKQALPPRLRDRQKEQPGG